MQGAIRGQDYAVQLKQPETPRNGPHTHPNTTKMRCYFTHVFIKCPLCRNQKLLLVYPVCSRAHSPKRNPYTLGCAVMGFCLLYTYHKQIVIKVGSPMHSRVDCNCLSTIFGAG